VKTIHQIVLALGSNVGNRRENLMRAVAEIESFAEVRARSKIYETVPVGFSDQRDFLNAAIFARTEYSPAELLEFCKYAEKKIGRIETFRNGPRAIDIDIILYGAETFESETLCIPHPRWKDRDFVISPMLDLFEMRLFDDVCFSGVREFLSVASKKFPPFSSL